MCNKLIAAGDVLDKDPMIPILAGPFSEEQFKAAEGLQLIRLLLDIILDA